MPTLINIIITDDHALVLSGIKNYLEKESRIKVVGEANNGLTLLNLLSKSNPLPHLVIIDLKMPILSGEEAVERIIKLYPNLKILILSMDADIPTIAKLFNIGIHGYITKADPPENLIQAVFDIIDTGICRNSYFDLQLEADNWFSNTKNIKSTLNYNEFEYIRLCAQGLSYKHIAERVNKSIKTVENYRDSVYKKLSINNQKSLLLFANNERIL
jgi:DNA-binding NarL/FixJ family response regulator